MTLLFILFVLILGLFVYLNILVEDNDKEKDYEQPKSTTNSKSSHLDKLFD